MIRYLLVLLILSTFSCDRKPTIIVNQFALDTMTAYGSGRISEWSGKDSFLLGYDVVMEDYFISQGYGYRLAECKSAWKVFKDGNRVIIVGTVAKSHPEGFYFSWVSRIDDKGLTVEFLAIGSEIKIGSSYPNGVLPY